MKYEEVIMNEMIAYCGLACHECPTYLATKNNDDKKRAEVAEQWSNQYNTVLKPEEINCDGCLTDGGVLFKHCQVCEIRKCGIDKGVVTCAHCDEYACEKLENFFNLVPECKELLEGIRGGI